MSFVRFFMLFVPCRRAGPYDELSANVLSDPLFTQGDSPKIVIIAVSAAGSVLLILNIVLVACYLTRRRKKKTMEEGLLCVLFCLFVFFRLLALHCFACCLVCSKSREKRRRRIEAQKWLEAARYCCCTPQISIPFQPKLPFFLSFVSPAAIVVVLTLYFSCLAQPCPAKEAAANRPPLKCTRPAATMKRSMERRSVPSRKRANRTAKTEATATTR